MDLSLRFSCEHCVLCRTVCVRCVCTKNFLLAGVCESTHKTHCRNIVFDPIRWMAFGILLTKNKPKQKYLMNRNNERFQRINQIDSETTNGLFPFSVIPVQMRMPPLIVIVDSSTFDNLWLDKFFIDFREWKCYKRIVVIMIVHGSELNLGYFFLNRNVVLKSIRLP